MKPAKRTQRRANVDMLAAMNGLSPRTIRDHLKKKGAPRPNQKGFYVTAEALRFLAVAIGGGPTGGEGKEMVGLKTRRAQVALELEEIELKIKRGEYIERAKIKATVDKVGAELAVMLRQAFELELPFKYRGKSPVECQQMNIKALDAVVKHFREGNDPAQLKTE